MLVFVDSYEVFYFQIVSYLRLIGVNLKWGVFEENLGRLFNNRLAN